MVSSFQIREPDYGQLSPAAWPRVILGVLGVLSVIYLVQSLRQGAHQPDPAMPKDLMAIVSHWRNVIWVFVLFLAYLLTMPWIGMLLGGMGFVFLLLTALGGFQRTILHLIIAVVSVGGVWAIFTYALGVLLPKGEWTGL